MNQDSTDPVQPSDPAQPQSGGNRPKWLTRKEYTDPAEKKRDFWIGVVLFFILNVVLALCQFGLGFGLIDTWSGSSDILIGIVAVLFWLLPWAVNIGLIVLFALTRSQIALGMLAGFGIILALAIAAGIIFTIWCFVALSSSGF